MTDLERVELAAHRTASHYIVGTEAHIMWRLFAASLETLNRGTDQRDVQKMLEQERSK